MPFLLANIAMFTRLWFALARTVGWIAHWKEMLDQPGHKISRPRQLYTGDAERSFVAKDKRG
ncbi:Citrate synthase I fragement, degenerate [Shewanella piezotolerans WP3]|uniref:Citrate synthase I fragement, degenerate n=1 Tax=Shewanella piezotolerans (strain WP3 / JCM 13877) TaxID=225849 RepID=B8CR09_SHEPW|nr:Citrate synthase I fragement, degenerate [Shewanella piezotolerans WP3]